MDYKIVTADSPEHLQEEVEQAMSYYGYTPQGGIAVANGIWAQALTRTHDQALVARARRES